MKKPRIPNTKTSSLYNKLFNNEFHPYISLFTAGIYLKFTKPPYGDHFRVRKLGCSAVSHNGITFIVPEKHFSNFKAPDLIDPDKNLCIHYQPFYSNLSRLVTFEYRISESFRHGTFEYQGNTYEVF